VLDHFGNLAAAPPGPALRRFGSAEDSQRAGPTGISSVQFSAANRSPLGGLHLENGQFNRIVQLHRSPSTSSRLGAAHHPPVIARTPWRIQSPCGWRETP